MGSRKLIKPDQTHQKHENCNKNKKTGCAMPSSSRKKTGATSDDSHCKEIVMGDFNKIIIRPIRHNKPSKCNNNHSATSGNETLRRKPTPDSSKRIHEKSDRFESHHVRPRKRTSSSSLLNQETRNFKDGDHKNNYRRGDCKRSRPSGREDSSKGRNRRRIQSADGDGDTNLKGCNIKGTLTPKWNQSQLTVNPGSWLGIEYRKKLAKEQEVSTKKKEIGDNERTLPKVSAAFTHQARTPSPSLLQDMYSPSEQLNTNKDDVVVLSTSLTPSSPPRSPESSFVSRHRLRYRKKSTNKKNENWEVESDPGQMSHESSDSSETDEEVAIIASIPGQEKINVEQDNRASSKPYPSEAATSGASNDVELESQTVKENKSVSNDDGDEDCDPCNRETRKCDDDGVSTVGSDCDGDCQNKNGEAKAQASATILLNKTESLNQGAAGQEIVQGKDENGDNLKKPEIEVIVLDDD